MFAMLVAVLLTQVQEPNPEVYARPPRLERVQRAGGRTGPGFAFFEAFPASGAGTTTACSTTAPTGAKGEALTFTRTGSATCTKTASGGLATTGIADGDLVTLSGNVARVEYDSAGTLGLLVESSRTNSTLRSQEFNNATWLKSSSGATAAAVTATDSATAPDGTVTAESVTFYATTAAQFSGLIQQGVFAANTSSGSVYIKGQSTSGTTDICVMNAAGSGYNCTACAFVSTSWTRCLHQNTSSTTSGYLLIGNASVYNGGTARAQADVYLWGAQGEQGAAYATSYIPTTSAAAVRNAETASFALSLATTAGVCTAATHWVPATTTYAAGSGLWAPGLSALAGSFASPYMWPYTTGAGTNLSIDGTGSSGAPSAYAPGTLNASVTARYVASHNGTAWRVCKDGTCSVNGSSSSWSSPTYSHVKLSGASASDVLWSRVQVDNNYLRCR